MTGLSFHTDCWFQLAASAGVMDWPGLLGGRHPRTSTSFSPDCEVVMDCQRHRCWGQADAGSGECPVPILVMRIRPRADGVRVMTEALPANEHRSYPGEVIPEGISDSFLTASTSLLRLPHEPRILVTHLVQTIY